MEFFWDFLGWAVTAQNLEGLFGSLNSEKCCFKSCMCMENAGNGLWIGPKTWDRNCRNSLENLWAVRDSPKIQWVWVGLTCVLNGCLVCIGPGMAVDFGFTK